ncbi:hypothetical protein, partial [Methanolobus chelungpuianus]|uniref:hypothetical protein n=1 Tax=Methanolobus chelungpuianus TaxID=502115 RepID=UPI002114FD57
YSCNNSVLLAGNDRIRKLLERFFFAHSHTPRVFYDFVLYSIRVMDQQLRQAMANIYMYRLRVVYKPYSKPA